MKRLTQKQKKELGEKTRFWATHASHWGIALGFMVMTLGTLYVLWGNDAAFAAVVLGY